jgi:leader peptidase (prepilin peptidase)/N-methyltransferase
MNSWIAPQLLTGVYIVILSLIIVYDVRHYRVPNILVLPATGLALLAGVLSGRDAFLLTLAGALTGFVFFYALYGLGRKAYGRPVLGFGDVKLAMLIGAMLGILMVLPALALGILLAGLGGLALLLTKQAGLRSTIPYGAFMAAGAIIVLVSLTI